MIDIDIDDFFEVKSVMEQALTLSTQIKNRLNPYIVSRLEKLQEGEIITPEWLDVVEEGCQALIQDLGVRKTLAREHMVAYILSERGAEAFGVNNFKK